MCPESFAGFRFDLGPLLQGQMWFFIPIMTYPYQGFRISSLLWNLAWLTFWSILFYWVACNGNEFEHLNLPNLKEPISPLLLVVQVLDVKTTYRKSCARIYNRFPI